MATLKCRPRKDGSLAFNVVWVLGGGRNGTGPSASETFNTKGAALAFQAEVEAAGHQWPAGWVKGRGYTDRPDPSTTVTLDAVAASFWLAQEKRVRRGLKKAYTLQRERRAYALHLQPTFGAMAFESIQAADIADWVDMQLDLEASPKSIQNRHGLLSPIITFGQKHLKLRPDNPCEITELPRRASRRDFMFFQEGEWALVRQCLRLDARLICDTLLSTGIRWGEVSALQVHDLDVADEDTIHIHVRRAWAKRADEEKAPIKVEQGENKSWQLFAPKSGRGRHVTVVGQVAHALRAEIEGRDPGAYVFTTREGNPWRYPDFHSDRWQPAVHFAKQSGLRKHATIHMLRHTAVVHALARGVDVYKVSAMLGHSSIQTTYDIYGGMLDLHDPVMARAMAQVLMSVAEAITPRVDQDEIQNRVIRPGRRGEQRVRKAAF